MKALLKKLNIEKLNPGACTGIDGWIHGEGPILTSYNPATNEAIASVRQATPDVYNRIIEHARTTFDVWRTIPAPKRGDVVRDLGNILREYKEPLGELVSLEMGKIRVEGMGEVQEMIDICDFSVGLSRQLYGLTIASERPSHRMYEQWHPLGVIGIITAFNFPVAVWSWNAAIASVCGDVTVWKPSSQTPLTAVATQHLCNMIMADHGLDGIFNLVIGRGRDVGNLLHDDERIPLISFTGSSTTGKTVATQVASRLGRTLLELGGNNAIIVTENADLELAIPSIVFGAIGTTGQRCTSTRRVITHKSIMPVLTEKLIHAYKQVPMGNPVDDAILVGPMVSVDAVDEMMNAIEQAKTEGGKLVTGGRRCPELGPNFAEPTIIRMPAQTDIVGKETFAPILYLLEYEEIDEALSLNNDVPQGLSSGIFTDSVRQAERFLSGIGSDCGIANVNIGTSGAEIGGAFGGEKDTGGGARVWLGCVEIVHAAPDQYHQLVERSTACSGHCLRYGKLKQPKWRGI